MHISLIPETERSIVQKFGKYFLQGGMSSLVDAEVKLAAPRSKKSVLQITYPM